MSLPLSRDLTLSPGVSQIPSATLNTMQDLDVRLWRLLAGADLALVDDFLVYTNATALATAWSLSGNATETMVDDSAAGGSGCVNLNGGSAISSIKTVFQISLGLADFDLAFRLRVPTKGAASFFAGLAASGAPIFQYASGTGANWQAGVAGTSIVNSGIAVSNAYQVLQIRRVSTTYYWFIDGAQVHSATSSFNDTSDTPTCSLFTPATGASVRVDAIKLWGAR